MESIVKELNAKNLIEFLKKKHLHELWGFPDGASGKEPICQCRRHKRHRFNSWVRKIPWRGNPLEWANHFNIHA